MSEPKELTPEDVAGYQDFESRDPEQWEHVKKDVDRMEDTLADLFEKPKE